jgi:hypothetical protein
LGISRDGFGETSGAIFLASTGHDTKGGNSGINRYSLPLSVGLEDVLDIIDHLGSAPDARGVT